LNSDLSGFAPDQALVRPLVETNRRFWMLVGILCSVMAVGAVCYVMQLRNGLQVTGMNVPVYWGVYITNFVFFIGISHAGTLISAILRICQAEWRRSITRAAEVITVMVLFFGAGSIMLDLGRPDRALNVILHPNFESPLLWDVTSISVYLTGSIIYLYLPLIPDLALLRDGLGKRRWLYRAMALGWTGSERQHRLLERAISIMAIIILPIAVSVHTVVSWVFAMTVQPMWHSAIFGPYFVVGAIFSGIGALIVFMAIIRWAYGLEGYFKEIQFRNLGLLLLTMSMLWFYFTLSEFITTYYGAEPDHMVIFWAKLTGLYAPMFWTMVVGCFVIPMTLLSTRLLPVVPSTVIAGVTVNIGMWIERYTIVVPSLARPRLPLETGVYYPSFVEIAMTVSFFAGFFLLYLLFTRLFPIVAIWEIREGREVSVKEVSERVASYLPEVSDAQDA